MCGQHLPLQVEPSWFSFWLWTHMPTLSGPQLIHTSGLQTHPGMLCGGSGIGHLWNPEHGSLLPPNPGYFTPSKQKSLIVPSSLENGTSPPLFRAKGLALSSWSQGHYLQGLDYDSYYNLKGKGFLEISC